MNLLSSGELQSMSTQQYSAVLDSSKVLSASHPQSKMVKEVGDNIVKGVETFLKQENKMNRIKGFEWEFKVIDEDIVNAWCMPGGKVAFYTGILDITEDEAGTAVVMGHEIAHAVAYHGNERMSQGALLQTAGATLSVLLSEKPEATQQLFMQSYGVAAGLGQLAYSRKHESEADKMGLVFMAIAGYDPREAPKFWQRMSEQGGAAPPEFLSTHPSDETRIKELEEFMPTALQYYRNNR